MLRIFSKLLMTDCEGLQLTTKRHLIKLRGVEPSQAKSLEQKLAEMNYKDPAIFYKVDIGLPSEKRKRSKVMKEQIAHLQEKRKDSNLEKAARLLKLNIPPEEVQEEWLKECAPVHIRTVAEHYGIFDDLYNDAFFTPRVMLDIGFRQKDGREAPVHRGNIVKPFEAENEPVVTFASKPEELWTLILTNPDGDLTKVDSECIHWFVGNIPGGDITKGEVVFDYLRPFPPRGVGFQRFVFVLYKQNQILDYSSLKQPLPRLSLQDRSFCTLDFYRERQDDITPAGLAFFQSDWDRSVKNTFHNVLNMEEPIYEYQHEPQPRRNQKLYPCRAVFNLYMDKFRDKQTLAKPYLVRKLKELDPFQAPVKPFPYPLIYRYEGRKDPNMPSWYSYERKRDKRGQGYINLLKHDDYDDPK